jgi:class 3 adenylate cyclase
VTESRELDKTPSLEIDASGLRVAEEYRRGKETSVLAIMFTDIVGSTELREQLGEVAYELQREAHDESIRDLVELDRAGAVVKSTGDGALAVFAEPSTAVAKALQIQASLASHNYFKLRIGIDMGQVTVNSQRGIVADVFGRQVNRAARIESIAEPKHVLTSFQVYDCAVGWLVGTQVKWHSHGTASLKGFSEPISIHEAYDPLVVAPQSLRSEPQEVCEPKKQTEPKSRRYPVRIRPVQVISMPDPIHFYVQALTLIVIRFLQLTQFPPEILWVDDFPQNNIAIQSMLLKAGFKVELVLNTSDAIQKLALRSYTLVISDMGRDGNPTAGIDLLEWLQQQPGSPPAIIFCSSRGVSLYGLEAVETGALTCTAGLISLLDGILQVVEQSLYFIEI